MIIYVVKNEIQKILEGMKIIKKFNNKKSLNYNNKYFKLNSNHLNYNRINNKQFKKLNNHLKYHKIEIIQKLQIQRGKFTIIKTAKIIKTLMKYQRNQLMKSKKILLKLKNKSE